MKSKITPKDKNALSEVLVRSIRDGAQVGVVRALLHAGARPDASEKWAVDGKVTPLMIATSVYYLPEEVNPLIKAFAKAGADLHAKDSDGVNVEGWAKANHNGAFAEQLKKSQGQRKP